MTTVCCVCRRVKQGPDWVEAVASRDVAVSHGYCPDCAAVARVELALLQLKELLEEHDSHPLSAVA